MSKGAPPTAHLSNLSATMGSVFSLGGAVTARLTVPMDLMKKTAVSILTIIS